MPRSVYLVRVEVAPQAQAAWERWQGEQHIPELLKEPGFLGARMLVDEAKAPDGWTRYVVQYELSDRAALTAYLSGPSAGRLRKDHTERFGAVTRISRELWNETGYRSDPNHGD